MYYFNEEHKNNLKVLVERFPAAMKSTEYASACYIVAHPEIFENIDVNRLKGSPFDWYFDKFYDDHPGLGGSNALTGSATRLAELGLNLWNRESNFNLATGLDVWGDRNYEVFLQAVELRACRKSIEI